MAEAEANSGLQKVSPDIQISIVVCKQEFPTFDSQHLYWGASQNQTILYYLVKNLLKCRRRIKVINYTIQSVLSTHPELKSDQGKLLMERTFNTTGCPASRWDEDKAKTALFQPFCRGRGIGS